MEAGTLPKNEPVELLIVDYRQCFDSLWLEECCNDLFEAGVQDDEIALIYKKINSNNKISVKTPFGESERKRIEKLVLQAERSCKDLDIILTFPNSI